MNKFAFLILSKIVSSPGIDRRTLVSDIQKEYRKSPHEIAIVIADLRGQELLAETDQGFKPIATKDEFYQKMQPFSDDEVLDLMIKHLNKTGGPEVISHLNSGSKLYLNREDEDYYEALLTQNDFVRTTYPSGPTIPTFFISNSGKINMRKYGGYLEYLEAQKPREKPEDKVLKYLSLGADFTYPLYNVFEECNIEFSQIRSILAVLGDRVHVFESSVDGLPDGIRISDEGLVYLHSGKISSTKNINIVMDHSTHTHGHNSLINEGNITSGNNNTINSGDNVTQSVSISINAGNWESLKKTLVENGIDEADIIELKNIVETEKPEGKILGSNALNWVIDVSRKALQGIGKIAIGVGSNLIATWIKNYYGIHN